MNFYILFDVCMVILIFIMGYYFYKSNGKGAVIDTRFNGIGCLIAWCIWAVMFILLLADRHKRER